MLQRALRVYRREGLDGVMDRLRRRARRGIARAQRIARTSVVTSAYGVRLVANWPDATFRFYVDGTYGDFLVGVISRQDRPFLFLDIGANQGLYSILAARNPACRGVYAFEPIPTTANRLRRNLDLNAVASRVTVVEAAISDRVGSAVIHVAGQHTGGASLRGHGAVPGTTPVEVRLIDANALRPLLQSGDLPLVVKVDVEGHEVEVLRELIRAGLADRMQSIFYECDEDWVRPDEIEAMLRQAGFAQFIRVGEGRHYDVLAQRASGD